MLIYFSAEGYSMKAESAISRIFAVIGIVLVIIAAVVVYQFMGSPDSSPPTYSNISASPTSPSSSCTFKVLWTDNVNVSGYILGTNNTGTFTNDTWTSFSNFVNSTFAYSSVTKTLNGTMGNVVRWRFWCNDSSNNWNRITLQNLLVDSNRVRLMTSMGNITIELYDDMPITTGNFKNLVKTKVYDGTIFHRVALGFVIQGGDATSKGITVPTIPDELPNKHSNVRGSVAMAKTSDPDSATSQFFINLNDANALNLDSNYSVFGMVTEGMSVVDAINQVPVDTPGDGKPLQDVTLTVAQMIN
jgi:cyclophilin family peptidyl-prolyl cis-trans isomerase